MPQQDQSVIYPFSIRESLGYQNVKQALEQVFSIDLDTIAIHEGEDENFNFYNHVQDVKDFLARWQSPSKEEALKELDRIGL